MYFRGSFLKWDRQLREGTVEDNQLVDGSRLTLLPSVETGLLAQRPEQSVMQALESLNDSQVNDFLSGKAPLNLTMRLGDHMMLIQLQLSTVAPAPSSSSSSGGGTASSSNSGSGSTSAGSSASTSSGSSATAATSGVSASSSAATAATTAPSSSTRLSRSNCDCSSSAQGCTSGSSSERCRCDGASSSSTPSGSSTTSSSSSTSAGTTSNNPGGASLLDTRALSEASRNLTQTLKQLSSEVLTSKYEHSTHEGLGRRQGAIIESMHHHGKGVYSGTFSGTLNPALQDKFGRPKRDISTIIHILNDLLCATPQYRAVQQQGGSAVSAATGTPQVSPVSHASPTTGLNSSGSGSLGGGTQSGSSLLEAASHLQTNPRLNSDGSVLSGGGQEDVEIEESRENRATRGKMERLRLVLNQRRERRRAMRSRPYTSGPGGGGAAGGSANPAAPPPPCPPDSVTA